MGIWSGFWNKPPEIVPPPEKSGDELFAEWLEKSSRAELLVGLKDFRRRRKDMGDFAEGGDLSPADNTTIDNLDKEIAEIEKRLRGLPEMERAA
jgi:hypothetical protein